MNAYLITENFNLTIATMEDGYGIARIVECVNLQMEW